MRGARVNEVVNRPSNRAPASRASSSNSDPLHSRARIDKSPKASPESSRSPHGSSVSNPSNPKKLGTRIANLESQLGLAQEELISLKGQLSSTEISKKAAQNQLKPKKSVEIEDKHFRIQTDASSKKKNSAWHEIDDSLRGTDVFEVPLEESAPELIDKEPEVQEISTLKANLAKKDRELEALRLENKRLTIQLEEKSAKILSSQSEIDELKSKLNDVKQELEESRTTVVQINSRMEVVEKARVEMDNEMKRLTVHTEQWRKAADAAAAVLAGGADANFRKISDRCGSMDTHYVNSLGFAGFVGSPAMIDDVFVNEKRKASGIRMLGDMMKKKGQK